MANNNLIGRIAWRYLRGKGQANAVPVLSRISMVAISVSAAAMIILFSVFNGFEDLIEHLYHAFYPDIKITAARGKFFVPDESLGRAIAGRTEIAGLTRVIEDNALVNTEEGETIPVTVKGVDENYFAVNELREHINKGIDTLFHAPEITTAFLGQYVASALGVDVNNVFSRISVYYPNPEQKGVVLNPEEAFSSLILQPDASFAVQEEFDSKYIIAPLLPVQQLMRQPAGITGIELKLKPGADPEKVQHALEAALGKQFVVATRYTQNKAVYMVMSSEKWAGYAILMFVLIIASFNMVSALALLVLEKQKDMGILTAMGLLPSKLRLLIFAEGLLWALCGAAVGLALGLGLVWLQARFGFIKISGSFIIEAYPVSIRFGDVAVVLLTVAAVALAAAAYPAMRAAKQAAQGGFGGK